jgi:hypothetical protein
VNARTARTPPALGQLDGCGCSTVLCSFDPTALTGCTDGACNIRLPASSTPCTFTPCYSSAQHRKPHHHVSHGVDQAECRPARIILTQKSIVRGVKNPTISPPVQCAHLSVAPGIVAHTKCMTVRHASVLARRRTWRSVTRVFGAVSGQRFEEMTLTCFSPPLPERTGHNARVKRLCVPLGSVLGAPKLERSQLPTIAVCYVARSPVLHETSSQGRQQCRQT